MKTGIISDVIFVMITVVAPLCFIGWLLTAGMEMMQPLLAIISVK
jgi:hypothetical protein